MLLPLNLNVATNIIRVIKCHNEHVSHTIERWAEMSLMKSYYVWCL